jgi:hypothetical protein
VTEYTYDETTANQATGFSGFGGHLLFEGDGVAGLAGEDTGSLAALGITDAEQLIAIAAIPGVREELESVLGGQLAGLLDQANQALPAERVALVNAPAPADRGLGVLPPTEEMLTAAAASGMQAAFAFAPVTLPAAVNLIPYMQPIRNQGARGTCVSFTLTALNEYILRRRGLLRNLSEQHLYYEIKLIDGSPNGCGTWQAKAVNALQVRGQCREQVWPYNANPPCNNHGPLPPQARSDGLQQRLATVQVPARDVQAYKTHLSKQRPVTLSIAVYNSWYQSAETQRSGRITMRVGNEAAVGGHAICLVGYQDTPTSPGGGYFIVRNHWGTGWAAQSPYSAGYGTIPYQYIANEAWEAFTAIVPGITADGQLTDDGQLVSGSSTVTIEVRPNITITISPS